MSIRQLVKKINPVRGRMLKASEDVRARLDSNGVNPVRSKVHFAPANVLGRWTSNGVKPVRNKSPLAAAGVRAHLISNGVKQDHGEWKKSVLLPIFIILLAFLSFGLGRLSVDMKANTPVVITKAPEQIFGSSTGTVTMHPKAQHIVASKNGTRYYLPWCTGASRIHEENKIWFETEKAAQKYGLTPAQNCDGF